MTRKWVITGLFVNNCLQFCLYFRWLRSITWNKATAQFMRHAIRHIFAADRVFFNLRSMWNLRSQSEPISRARLEIFASDQNLFLVWIFLIRHVKVICFFFWTKNVFETVIFDDIHLGVKSARTHTEFNLMIF